MISPGKFSIFRKFVITAALAVFGVGFCAGVFWWLSSSVRAGIESLRTIGEKITALEDGRRSARSSASLFEERKTDIERIRNFSPNRERPVELIEELESLGHSTGNAITLDFDEARSKANGRLVFRLTVEGSEREPREYLKLLELMPYEIRVEDLAFQQIALQSSSASQTKAASSIPTHRLILVISVKTL